MSAELKPCPFCGGNEVYREHTDNMRIWWFSCFACGTNGPRKLSPEDAETAWNRRADDDKC